VPRLLPGIALATAVALASVGVAAVESRIFGHPIIEALVVAILLGMVVRSCWTPPAVFDAGVRFTGKQVLEVAVFLLGASVDLPLLLEAGPALVIGIVFLVILGLPMLIQPLALSNYQYGVLAGLTVYAVPQVLAAAFPVSVLSGQVGTLVKLVRVLMLGPVVLGIALWHRNEAAGADTGTATRTAAGTRFNLARFVPWFIAGFLALALLRSTGIVPEPWIAPTRSLSTWLTVGAMAALGLGVDLRAISRVGRPVVITVSASLAVLIVLAVTLIRLLAIR
jgi:uncharacterized membrane protein YadS